MQRTSTSLLLHSANMTFDTNLSTFCDSELFKRMCRNQGLSLDWVNNIEIIWIN